MDKGIAEYHTGNLLKHMKDNNIILRLYTVYFQDNKNCFAVSVNRNTSIYSTSFPLEKNQWIISRIYHITLDFGNDVYMNRKDLLIKTHFKYLNEIFEDFCKYNIGHDPLYRFSWGSTKELILYNEHGIIIP